MRDRLRELLVCPHCKEPFRVSVFKQEGERVVDGLLVSECGRAYPIVNTIPRILPDAFDNQPQFVRIYKDRIGPYLTSAAAASRGKDNSLIEKTRKSFGYQWTNFSAMINAFKEDFLEYVYPVNRDFFAGKLGLDAGCGMGRHIYYAAEFGADMVGIDLSSAIDATYQNVKENPRIDLVQCDIYNLPFKPNTFDFVYSIGVLHHLPNPEKGFGRLVDATRTSVFIWVYSKTRVILNFLLEGTRRITVRIPHGLLRKICFFLAGTEWLFFIKPYNLARKAVPRLAWAIDAVTPARIKLYARHPFFVCHTDWFDRLAAPIRFYYDGDDLTGWAARANLKNVSISPTGLYGWRLYGEKT